MPRATTYIFEGILSNNFNGEKLLPKISRRSYLSANYNCSSFYLPQLVKMFFSHSSLAALCHMPLLILPFVIPVAADDSSQLCFTNLTYSPFTPWFKAWPNVTSGPNIGANVNDSSCCLLISSLNSAKKKCLLEAAEQWHAGGTQTAASVSPPTRASNNTPPRPSSWASFP